MLNNYSAPQILYLEDLALAEFQRDQFNRLVNYDWTESWIREGISLTETEMTSLLVFLDVILGVIPIVTESTLMSS